MICTSFSRLLSKQDTLLPTVALYIARYLKFLLDLFHSWILSRGAVIRIEGFSCCMSARSMILSNMRWGDFVCDPTQG
jgi:hypothetical protein